MKYKIILSALSAVLGTAMLGISMLGISFNAYSQNISKNEVPSAVQTAFQQKFPDAKSVQWSKESDTELEAEFKMNGKKMSANFSPDGQWKETETDISKNDLPQKVQSTLQSQFKDYKIKDAEQVATPDQANLYEVGMEQGETTLEVVLNQDGKVIKKQTEEEDEKGEKGEDEDEDEDGQH